MKIKNLNIDSDPRLEQYILDLTGEHILLSTCIRTAVTPECTTFNVVCRFDDEFLNCCAMMCRQLTLYHNMSCGAVVSTVRSAANSCKYVPTSKLICPNNKRVLNTSLQCSTRKLAGCGKMLFKGMGYNCDTIRYMAQTKRSFILSDGHQYFYITGYRIVKPKFSHERFFLSGYSGKDGSKVYLDYKDHIPFLSYIFV